MNVCGIVAFSSSNRALYAACSSGPYAGLFIGSTYCGVRAKTVRWATSSAIVWITWMPVAPMPTTPTRLPASSTPPTGQREVWWISPRKLSWPSKTFSIGADSIPAQLTKNCASTTSPRSVRIVQRPRSSS